MVTNHLPAVQDSNLSDFSLHLCKSENRPLMDPFFYLKEGPFVLRMYPYLGSAAFPSSPIPRGCSGKGILLEDTLHLKYQNLGDAMR